MTAVFFRCAENAEIFAGRIEDARRCAANRLNAIVIRRDAVNEEQRFGCVAVEQLDLADLREFLVLRR